MIFSVFDIHKQRKKRATIPWSTPQVCKLLSITHTNISRKITNTSIAGSSYFVVFIDEATAISDLYFLRESPDLLWALKFYKNLIKNGWNYRLYGITLDKAGEHVNRELKSIPTKKGMALA